MKSLVFLLGLLPTAALANGGGYFRGGVSATGDAAGFVPAEIGKVRILDEKLTIRFGPKEADVEVRYLMKNVTDGKANVRFGFPIEELADYSYGSASTDNKAPAELKYCRNYQITAGGKSLKVNFSEEAKPATAARFNGIAGWLVSEMNLSGGEEKSVRIRFQSSYPGEVWSVSDDESLSAKRFNYRLSTAACWAGTIGAGSITLIPTGIPVGELKVIKPVNRFKKEGDSWVWRFENLEPTLADDFEVEAVPEIHSYSSGGEHQIVSGKPRAGETFTERGGKWSVSHTNYKVSASSTLPPENHRQYAADNIRNDDNSFWSEGAAGSGEGEWLEIVPAEPKPIIALDILPGCWNSKELFTANSRPKKLIVELNDSHRFPVNVPDGMQALHIPVANYAKAVKKIRLTFEDVWPGTKYEDLCVSRVRLHVRLDKKPKIRPAR
ncbi:MAG: DUF4424 family protein [Verrucomicrobiota bacterium]